MIRLLQKSETLVLSHHTWNQVRYLRNRNTPKNLEKPTASSVEEKRKTREILQLPAIQELLKKEFHKGEISGKKAGIREGIAMQRLAFQEAEERGSTAKKVSDFLNRKLGIDETSTGDAEIELKEEYFSLGYAHARDNAKAKVSKAYRDGKKEGYAEGYKQGSFAALKKTADISEQISKVPGKLGNAYFYLLNKLTPPTKK